ncbi:RNA polymerase sigma-70 factor (ECF subfamily) [Kribbella aluminosa]|uniref:RNA polymerase sigma-70 factor (ECF subfamily) n=1 Tax=Kribbella aluminosa TaxID=416017 RepID=A0ABS4URE4_9ACTN|nr:sigma-70 family RNA polymerase sigma factor [Kribbella aluminosa]MBP2354203.1 RNA polymerase sigma-70 factor (ECF subfamily) [Kribbella aluminosa]
MIDERACRTTVMELCLAERESLRRYVASILGRDSHAVEDVVQETLLRAWQQADRIEWQDRPVRMWLFRVARNLVVDHHRRAGRAVPMGLGATELAEPDSQPDPAEQVIDRRVLVEILQRLSPAHREVVARVHLLGHAGEEVAAVLGVPVGTVKSRAHNAVRQLRAELARTDWAGVAA